MGTTVPLQPIAAVEINLDKLFTDEYEFVIPEYQRPYTWGVEHAVQLLVDLQEALERDLDEPYFLGSIVLVKDAQTTRDPDPVAGGVAGHCGGSQPAQGHP